MDHEDSCPETQVGYLCQQRAMHFNGCSAGAGVSAKLQHYRLTAVVGPSESDLTCLMRLLAGRAASSSILSGSARTVLGDSFLGCRSTIGYATPVSPPTALSTSCYSGAHAS